MSNLPKGYDALQALMSLQGGIVARWRGEQRGEVYVCRDCKDAVDEKRRADREAALTLLADREGRWYEAVFAESFPTIAELYEEAYGKAVR